MLNKCAVCQKPYVVPHHRGWYEYYIPRVCSAQCFARLCREGYEQISFPERDTRNKPFESSDRSFRSSYERDFAEYLHRLKLPFQFEPRVFYFGSGAGYVPDFLVAGSVFCEVKGLWLGDGKAKYLAFREEFDYPSFVIDKDFLNIMKRSL